MPPPNTPLIRTLFSGRLLRRSRVETYGTIFAIGQTAMFLYLALKYFGVLPGSSLAFGSDFLTFYTAGHLADDGRAGVAYDITRQFAEQVRILSRAALDGQVVFPYPPGFVLLMAVLAVLPYYPALALWSLGSLAFWGASLWKTTGNWRVAALLVSFPAAFTNFYIAQTAFLTAGLMGFGLLSLRCQPLLAGAVFGLLCYKPHFLVLLPIALIAGRCWTALMGMVMSIAAMTLLSLALFGWATWAAYFHFVPTMSGITFGGALGYWSYATPFAAIRLLGGSPDAARVGQGLVILATAIATAVIWRQTADPAIRALVLIGSTLLAVPILSSYDLTLATVAIAWIARDHQRASWPYWVRTILLIDWAIAFAGLPIAHHAGVPLLPLIGLSLLLLGLWRAAAVRTDRVPSAASTA